MRVGGGILKLIATLMRAVVDHHHAHVRRRDARLRRCALHQSFRRERLDHPPTLGHDASTNALIRRYREARGRMT